MAETYPPPRSMPAGLDEKTWVLIVYALFLLGFVSGGATALAGLVLAYVVRMRSGALGASHFVFLIRTFWYALLWLAVGAVVFVVGIPLTLILIGFPLILLGKAIVLIVAIWYGVRCVSGLLSALADRPHAQPQGWLI